MATVTQTGAVMASAVALEPYVDYALNGFHGQPPAGFGLLVAGALVTVSHATYALFRASKWGKRLISAQQALEAQAPPESKPA